MTIFRLTYDLYLLCVVSFFLFWEELFIKLQLSLFFYEVSLIINW